MSATKTYDLAAEQIGRYVQPLWQGMLLPPFDVKDEIGRPLRLADDYLSGQTLILVLLNRADDARRRQLLGELASRYDALEALETTVVAFSSDASAANNRALAAASGFRWPIAADGAGQVFAGYGVHMDHGIGDRIIVVTPFRQVHAWFDDCEDIATTLESIMSNIEQSSRPGAGGNLELHAPVLQIPNVVTREECAELIRAFESGSPFAVRPPKPGEFPGNYRIPVYDHNRQDRVDYIIKDAEMLRFLDERIFGRVVPMVKKAYAYDVTRREDLHIARYEGRREGNAIGHRDNVSAGTAHRRFALSMNLNDDYEGGDVVFKEFGPQGYKSPAGTAMVFSSALLHEVRETTAGVRYTLISHFFNEQSIPQR